ncbi:hypothetical protein GP644_23545 [Parasedimentitalea maritima]|uniref:Uncharacterized protein n=2 Tax=Parasedimentitalea maritima TaxID=2578117 RepID=A0A6A4RCH7_9RHOB|nr:hypothetical protein GP644_23545 [Zongyanglinia marina]
MNLMWRDRVDMSHSGDTIIADLEVRLANMPVGTKLQVGSAVIETSDLWNESCAKWKMCFGRECASAEFLGPNAA